MIQRVSPSVYSCAPVSAARCPQNHHNMTCLQSEPEDTFKVKLQQPTQENETYSCLSLKNKHQNTSIHTFHSLFLIAFQPCDFRAEARKCVCGGGGLRVGVGVCVPMTSAVCLHTSCVWGTSFLDKQCVCVCLYVCVCVCVCLRMCGEDRREMSDMKGSMKKCLVWRILRLRPQER